MLNLTKMKTLSAAALALAAIATPSFAAANSYSNTAYETCKRSDTENQVLGGVLGAVAGGVFGSQVAGNGARTEGSALGAVLGAVAGSQIANKDCRKTTVYRNDAYNSAAPVYSTQNTYSAPRVVTVKQPVYNNGRTNRDYGYNGYRDNSRFNQLAILDREINQTRRQLDELRQRDRYTNSRQLDRRIDQLGERLSNLKKQRKRLD